jgi:hypothetical protein
VNLAVVPVRAGDCNGSERSKDADD